MYTYTRDWDRLDRSDKIASGIGDVIGFFASGFFLELLWNAVVIDTFPLPSLDYWHALGLVWIAVILFRGRS